MRRLEPVRWWIRHNRLLSTIGGAAVLAVVNAALWTRPWALLVLAAAAAGCALIVLLPAYAADKATEHHSRRTQAAIEAATKRAIEAKRAAAAIQPSRKELTR